MKHSSRWNKLLLAVWLFKLYLGKCGADWACLALAFFYICLISSMNKWSIECDWKKEGWCKRHGGDTMHVLAAEFLTYHIFIFLAIWCTSSWCGYSTCYAPAWKHSRSLASGFDSWHLCFVFPALHTLRAVKKKFFTVCISRTCFVKSSMFAVSLHIGRSVSMSRADVMLLAISSSVYEKSRFNVGKKSFCFLY